MDKQIYLEGFIGDAKAPQRFDLSEFPVTIGRQDDCTLQLNIARISRQHARIDNSDGQLVLTDLGSTNGTFINHKRISDPTPLAFGDVVHFADHEFRLTADRVTAEAPTGELTMVGIDTLPNKFPTQAREFGEMLDQGLVRGFYQPIIDNRGELYGYELLGRGAHPQLSRSPYEMFMLAEAMDQEVELSELLRERCFAEAAEAGIRQPLFFNNHPKECRDPDRLLKQIGRLRGIYPDLNLNFEVHEAAVTDLAMMANIRAELKKMAIGLAYDDFGAGQARLLELVEVPPDVLKFDIGLVAGVTEPDSPKYRLLASLNRLVQDMGIPTLAEGIETEEMASACHSIGIDYFQGYYYGRPAPILGQAD